MIGLDPKETGTDAEKDQADLKGSHVAPDKLSTPQTFVRHIMSSVTNWLSRVGPMDLRVKKAEHKIVKEDRDITLDGWAKLDIFLEKSLSQNVASKMTLESKLAWQERKEQLLSDTTAKVTKKTVFIDRKVALTESILTAVQVNSDRITALTFSEANIPVDEAIVLATDDPDIAARGKVQNAIVDTFTKTTVPDTDDGTESGESDEKFQYMVEDIVAAIEGNDPV
ncbi:hypothetical protein KI688_008181 [Linnemannia hyalina]|uniref:Uncharacterized protein n=1 Tax=Linnemannia hyalina TaxID=64524 RepID=A0A9P8BWT9_9FUNG|nr:hypothetical protein KI688_008181 [Linnemannia hyalina]